MGKRGVSGTDWKAAKNDADRARQERKFKRETPAGRKERLRKITGRPKPNRRRYW